MIKRDAKTTELVAARSTPSVPPVARIPWKHETTPISRPNTIVFSVDGRKSRKAALLKPSWIKSRKEIGSVSVLATHPITMPKKSVTSVSNGSIKTQARTRVATRNLYGLTAEASMASICSVTFMALNSAPMPAAARPLTTSAVMIGPLSLMIEKTTTAGRNDLAPKRMRLSRVESVITTPVAAPASATNGSDFEPNSSNWWTNSWISYGGVQAAQIRRPQNAPRSPNHSKNATKDFLMLGERRFRRAETLLFVAAKAIPTTKAKTVRCTIIWHSREF